MCANWNPDLKTEALALCEEIENFSQDAFVAALDAEAFLRSQSFQAGVKAYHAHPYKRDVDDPKAIWHDGNTKLLDYGGSKDGPVMLAVPSLINRAYVLDLNQKRSFMRTMAQKGIRSFLVDWGNVEEAEKNLTLEDYILTRLNNCVEEIVRLTGKPVCLMGYCMGGVLTTAFTILNPENVAALILLATPWNFHAGHGTHTKIISATKLQLESTVNSFGVLPIDVIQSLFAAIDPYQTLKKFTDFAQLKQTSAAAQKFVAMEDWVNDGVPLSGPVAKECLFDWYVENKPGQTQWEMDGHLINPQEITCPTLLFIPERDRIVPKDSALALSKAIPNAQTKLVSAGHIGMVTGRKAASTLYTPLSKWLLSQNI